MGNENLKIQNDKVRSLKPCSVDDEHNGVKSGVEKVPDDDYGRLILKREIQDNKIHGANMGPTWVLSAPGGPYVGHMNLATRDATIPPPYL